MMVRKKLSLGLMLRVRDLDRSIGFYRDLLGMQLVGRSDYPKDELTFVSLRFPTDPALLELQHNWGSEVHYETGSGFGHLIIGTSDLEDCCRRIGAHRYPILESPRRSAKDKLLAAIVEDPDGYRVQLVERV